MSMTPPVQPIRERIERAIAARLETMKESAEYWSTPALVTRSLLDIDQYKLVLKTGPVLGVVRGSGSTREAASMTSWADEHRVGIWGYVLGDDQLLAGDRLNRLWEDTVTCLLPRDGEVGAFGGLVQDLRPDGPMDTDDGAREPFAFFRQHWLART
jgi:hypothetical protein